MRRADLWRHTALRLAVVISLGVLALVLMAGGIAYGLMQAQRTNRQTARIQESFDALRPALQQGDDRDLIEAVLARIAASPDRRSVYVLKSATGAVLAANVPDPGVALGWTMVEAARLGIATDYPYRLLAGQVGGYLLIVGQSDGDLDDLRELIANSLLWAAVVVLAVAIGAGAWLASRMQARLSAIDASMQRVALGDLTARLPVTGQGDDVDMIAALVNAALARLGQVLEAMRSVTEDIAHDLRTPLGRLRNRIEDAARKLGQGDGAALDLSQALADCDQINATFSALLRIAQIEAGDRTARFAPLDLGAVLTEVVAIYAPVAEDAGMTLTSTPVTGVIIQGDRALLIQLFANLIENALCHCPPGTSISCRLRGLVAEVRDTGPGIPKGQREAVFRRLYRLEHSRTTAGSGLGLSTVRAIAQLHGAEVTLGDGVPATASAPARGLVVTVSFAPG